MLKSLISSSGNLNKLLQTIENHIPVSVFGLGMPEKVLILNEFEGTKLVVCVNDEEAILLSKMLESVGKTTNLLLNNLETDVSNFSSFSQINLLTTLQNIVFNNVEYVVSSPNALLNKLPSVNYVKNLSLNLEVGKKYNAKFLIKKLTQMGYKRADVVTDSLQFSFKGDILTLYPINFENPIRISFFDDEIEFIKSFLIESQQLQTSYDSACVYSVNFLTEQKTINFEKLKFQSREAEENFNEIKFEVLKSVEDGVLPVWAMPYFNDFNYSLYEFFSDELIVFDNPKLILNNLTELVKENKSLIKEKIELGKLTNTHKNFYFDVPQLTEFGGLNAGLVAFQNLNNANNIYKPNAVFSIKTTPQINYGYNKTTIYDDVARNIMLGYTVIIFAENKELASKMAGMFLPKNVLTCTINSISQVQKNCVNLLTKSSTISCCFNEEKLIIIGLKNIKQNKKVNSAVSSFNNFLPEVGDYVVHNTYGIGKCVGITKLNVNSAQKDYIEIEYKNNDKLFLPVENIDSISKYVGGEKPKLNKLGSTEFLKTKQKVKEGIKKLTFDLKKLYAERSQVKGIEFPADDEIQEEFEKTCPFNLTNDQDRAVMEVKKDMQSKKAMDRLICGDVGFGKTEVALRAAFKAIMAGYQVMLLCPTTILSEQHYNTIMVRMKNFGVRAECLNRFKTKAETTKILKDLESGEIDIIVGTHRLLSADVKTKNLGLLILDEEQRFGVEHKEKIKRLKSNIDVLTLSATPIPRTMHASLIGIKDISVIETPPTGRVPVITAVTEQSDDVILNAIMRELNRDGQVLIVYNRVETIYEFCAHIKNLVGENVSIDVAHGQMDEKTLENAILNLYNGQTQILISTTLIENGVDLPRANTLIVINADMLGLGQLYQLKGRIGRSDKQGYAIFCYDKSKMLSEEAYKRLGAIVEYSGLGNGFKIAMRDLEIRGAGSLFGAEQSGHIESVGYSMYLSLLSEAVKELKGEKTNVVSDVKIDCYFDANLPNYYVENTSNRIEIYSEIAKINSKQKADEFLSKLEFNFGEVPKEVENLVYVARIKNSCPSFVKRVSITPNNSNIYFSYSNEEILKTLTQILANTKNQIVLNLENLPIITIKNDTKLFNTLENVENVLNLLSKNENK